MKQKENSFDTYTLAILFFFFTHNGLLEQVTYWNTFKKLTLNQW